LRFAIIVNVGKTDERNGGMELPTEQRYLTTDELAELCRTNSNSVRYWTHQGRGPRSFKVGRRRLYAVEDVEAWLEAERERQGGGSGAA
jgi:excisionase family DNA binding protein